MEPREPSEHMEHEDHREHEDHKEYGEDKELGEDTEHGEHKEHREDKEHGEDTERAENSVAIQITDKSLVEKTLLNGARLRYGGEHEDVAVDGVVSVVKILPFCALVIMFWAIYSQVIVLYCL